MDFSAFGGKLLEAFIPTITTAVATVATAVLVLLFKKIGLDVDEKQRAALKATVRDAVLAVEEQARQTKYQLAGDAKRDIAVRMVKRELPKADPAAINLQISATLPEVREQLGQQAKAPNSAVVGVDLGAGTDRNAKAFGRPKTAEEIARTVGK